jgi:hypothetical protein
LPEPVKRAIARGHADDGRRAGPSPHEIADDQIAAGMAFGFCIARAAVSRAVASPLAASRSAANLGQSSGTRSGLNVETSRSP